MPAGTVLVTPGLQSLGQPRSHAAGMRYHAVGEVFAAHLDELDCGGALVLRGGRRVPLDGLRWPAVGNALLWRTRTRSYCVRREPDPNDHTNC